MSGYAFSPLICAIFALILGLFVFLKNPKSSLNRTFALLSFETFNWQICWFFTYLTNNPAHWNLIVRIGFTAILFIPFTYYHFVIRILDLTQEMKKVALFYSLCMIWLFLLWFTNLYIAGYNKYSWGSYGKAGVLHPFYLVFVFLIIIRTLILLRKAVVNSSQSALSRNQNKFVFLAACLFCFASIEYLINYGIDFYPIGVFFILGSFLIFAYTIVRYRLMDINIALTRAGIFIFVYSFILGVPFWLGYKTKSWFPATSLAVFFASVGPFIYQYLRKRTEDILLREEHRYQQALKDLAKTLTLIKNMDKLLETVSLEIYNLIKVPVGIYLLDKENNIYVSKYMYPKGLDLSSAMPTNSLVIVLLKNNKRIVLSEELEFDSNFSNKNIGLTVPCIIKDELLGFIVLGQKSNLRLYSQLDIDILEIFSSYLSLAMENINYLKELEELQKQLIEKERLISASEISEAYSHELGNIINNISMASATLSFEDYTKEEVKNVYEAVKRNVKRAKDIFKAIESYNAKSKKEPVEINITELLKSRINAFEEKITTFQINLKENLVSDLPKIYVNENLSSVFDYILEAAIVSMEDKPQKELFISIKLIKDKKLIEIIFQDTGGDVTQDKLYHGVAPERGPVGGIYYFIARRIIFDHQGTWQIESNNNIGTRIIVNLPINKK